MTVAGDALARVWDVKTGSLVCSLEGHSDNIRSVVRVFCMFLFLLVFACVCLFVCVSVLDVLGTFLLLKHRKMMVVHVINRQHRYKQAKKERKKQTNKQISTKQNKTHAGDDQQGPFCHHRQR